MRTIKFRTWRERTREMCDMAETIARYTADTLFNRAEEFGLTIEQFTGLRDKNGRDVYEGDRCAVTFADGSKTNAVVSIIDGCADLCFVSPVVVAGQYRDRDYLKCYTVNHAVEIIGNVHDEAKP